MLRKFLSKNQIIYWPEDEVVSMFRIIHGAIKIFMIDDLGNENILAIRTADGFLPLEALFGKTKATFYYATLIDTEIEQTRREDFIAELDSNPGSYKALAHDAIELYLEAIRRIASVEARSAHERVRASKEYVDNLGIDVTQQTIADLSCVTRETASQMLNGRRRIRK